MGGNTLPVLQRHTSQLHLPSRNEISFLPLTTSFSIFFSTTSYISLSIEDKTALALHAGFPGLEYHDLEDQAPFPTTFLKHSDTLKHQVSGSALNITFVSIPSWHRLQDTAEKRPRKKPPSQQQIVSGKKTVRESKYSYSYPNSRNYRFISSTF